MPLLALALAAATASRLGSGKHDEPKLTAGFVPAVAAMDRADLVYLDAIAETLPTRSAVETLTMMASFRTSVHQIRQQTRTRIAEVYVRNQRSYGWFDPLDPHTPSTTGLTHADETRIATVADGARSEVEKLRASVNQSLAGRLQASQIEVLIAAKRRRRKAFEMELKTALETSVPSLAALTPAREDKVRYELGELADGWY